jgi:hypothetical protein
MTPLIQVILVVPLGMLLLTTSCAAEPEPASDSLNVLFIGNSYTGPQSLRNRQGNG